METLRLFVDSPSSSFFTDGACSFSDGAFDSPFPSSSDLTGAFFDVPAEGFFFNTTPLSPPFIPPGFFVTTAFCFSLSFPLDVVLVVLVGGEAIVAALGFEESPLPGRSGKMFRAATALMEMYRGAQREVDTVLAGYSLFKASNLLCVLQFTFEFLLLFIRPKSVEE